MGVHWKVPVSVIVWDERALFAIGCHYDMHGGALTDFVIDTKEWAYNTGLILGLHPASDRRRYKVTPSLIGWAQT